MRVGILAALVIMTMTACLSTALNTTSSEMGESNNRDLAAIPLVTAQGENGSHYVELIRLVDDQYLEEIGYSSDVLDEFVKSNITNREAMVATVSIFTLTSQTMSAFEQIEPPEEYVKYHFYMREALKYLKIYTWNMAKFYETGSNSYAIQAKEDFNLSIFYYEKGIEEYNSIHQPSAGN